MCRYLTFFVFPFCFFVFHFRLNLYLIFYVIAIIFLISRVQIHANCRIRRIYFSDRLYSEDELPPEFKLFLPITQQNNVGGQEMPAQG